MRGDKTRSKHTFKSLETAQWRVEEEFIQAIKGLGNITRTSFADAYKYMEFIEAIHLGMTQKQRIDLPL